MQLKALRPGLANWWEAHHQELLRRLKTTFFFAYFEIKKMSAGSGLGLIWMILDPLSRMLIYIFVFTVVFRLRLPGENSGAFSYAIYILMGLVPWTYINAVLMAGAGLVHSYAGFIRQPNFPYRILPNVLLLNHLPAHAVGVCIVLLLMAISGDFGKIDIPLLLLVYVLMLVAVRGASTFLGACAAVVPDVRTVLTLVLMLALYLSPILYLPEQLGRWIVIAVLNPFSYMLTTYKYALSGDPKYLIFNIWADLAVLAVLAIGALLLERWTLERIRYTGIDRVV